MSLQVWQEASGPERRACDDWTGAVEAGCLLVSPSPPSPHPPQERSNGLLDSLQRAVGPDLGLQQLRCLFPSQKERRLPPSLPFRPCPGNSPARPPSPPRCRLPHRLIASLQSSSGPRLFPLTSASSPARPSPTALLFAPAALTDSPTATSQHVSPHTSTSSPAPMYPHHQ